MACISWLMLRIIDIILGLCHSKVRRVDVALGNSSGMCEEKGCLELQLLDEGFEEPHGLCEDVHEAL